MKSTANTTKAKYQMPKTQEEFDAFMDEKNDNIQESIKIIEEIRAMLESPGRKEDNGIT